MFDIKAVIVATILSVAAAKEADPQKLLNNYKTFLQEHGKDLGRLKSPKRLQQYQENLKYIFEHNADPSTTFLLEPNKWTDAFDKELKISKIHWKHWKKFFSDDGDDDADDDDSYYSDDSPADDADDADDDDYDYATQKLTGDSYYYADDDDADDYDYATRKGTRATKKVAATKAMKQSKATKLSKTTKVAKEDLLVGDSYYYADDSNYDDADDYDDDDYDYATQKLTGDSYYYADDDNNYDDADDYDDDGYNYAVEGKAVRKADGHTLNWASRNNALGIRITPDVQNQQLKNTAGAVAAAASVVSNVNQIAKGRVLERIAPLRLIRSVKTGKIAESSLGYIARNRGINTGLKSGWLNSGQMATIQGFERVPMNDEAALMDKLLNGPVVVSICAGSKNFRYYKAGILNGACEGKDDKVGKYIDHTVLLTGYGTDKNNQDYWLVQNSWGKNWGEKGFARIARGDKKGSPGAFNIATRAVYPVGGMIYTSPFSFWYENLGIFLAFGLLGLGVMAMYGLTQRGLAKKNGETVSSIGLSTPKAGYETIPAADEESTIIQLNPTRPQIAAYQEL
jgi:hypothetical protein